MGTQLVVRTVNVGVCAAGLQGLFAFALTFVRSQCVLEECVHECEQMLWCFPGKRVPLLTDSL